MKHYFLLFLFVGFGMTSVAQKKMSANKKGISIRII